MINSRFFIARHEKYLRLCDAGYDIMPCMRYVGVLIAGVCVVSGAVAGPDGAMVRAAKVFLSPQKFPSTFNDLSFSERVDTLAEGYEPWETEYDSSGRCVRGCAYVGMNIEDELKMMRRQTNKVVADLRSAGYLSGGATNAATSGTQPSAVPVQPTVIPVMLPPNKPTSAQNESVNAGGASGTTTGASGAVGDIVELVSCSPRHSGIPTGQVIPLGEPVQGRPAITSPFGRRRHPTTGNMHNHGGVDLGVSRGTAIFATANGRVSNVWTDNTCGRGIKIAHGGGYETLFCHLDSQQVRTGDNVSAGCMIGMSGNTGRSTGPHLHYEIRQDGIKIDPVPLMGR